MVCPLAGAGWVRRKRQVEEGGYLMVDAFNASYTIAFTLKQEVRGG